MATVDFKRIDQVYDNLTATLIDTTPNSTMPVEEQDKRLAASCYQVCDLLTEWLEGGVWDSLRASVGGPVADFVQDQEQFDKLLPTLRDVLERASGPLIEAVPEYVGQAREALRAAADRDRKLFQKAEDKVGALKDEVCELAAQLRKHNATREQKTFARAKARKRLATVVMLLPPLFMAMAGVTPHQAERNLAQWGQILNVTAIQDIAVRAELPDRTPGSPRGDRGIRPEDRGIPPEGRRIPPRGIRPEDRGIPPEGRRIPAKGRRIRPKDLPTIPAPEIDIPGSYPPKRPGGVPGPGAKRGTPGPGQGKTRQGR